MYSNKTTLNSPPSDDDVYSAGVESVFFLVLELQISTPRSSKKPVQFPRHAEICQNNARKNCGKDLNSTPWFAPFYCLWVCLHDRDY